MLRYERRSTRSEILEATLRFSAAIVSVFLRLPWNLFGARAMLLLLIHAPLAVHAGDIYRINAGDLISIQVYGEEDMSLPKVRVGTGGKISMPLLGEFSIIDLTISEIEKKITKELLNGYLKKPEVTVSVLEYRMFYVSGQVKNPGGYNYVVGLTVRKAIAIAGGLSVRGSENKLKVIQESGHGEEVQVKMDAAMGPGDILNVGESFF